MVKRKMIGSNLKLFITDVDGVLTDGSMYYSENGDELKRFHTYDGVAIEILRKKGVKTAIITSENTRIVERRAEKLKIDYLYQGVKNKSKLEAALEICKNENITMKEVSYIGDDINCYELLKSVKYKACPKNANRLIKNIVGIKVLSTKGGDGVLREWVEYLFKDQ